MFVCEFCQVKFTWCLSIKSDWKQGVCLKDEEPKVPFRVLRHFTHKASVTSVNAEANVHSADWLMSVFVNELRSQGPAPCTQSTRSVCVQQCRRIVKGTLYIYTYNKPSPVLIVDCDITEQRPITDTLYELYILLLTPTPTFCNQIVAEMTKKSPQMSTSNPISLHLQS